MLFWNVAVNKTKKNPCPHGALPSSQRETNKTGDVKYIVCYVRISLTEENKAGKKPH